MLAEYLKQLRQRSQITPGGWAATSGIARTTLWRWEQGKTLPRDEELKAALTALAASPSEQMRAREILQQERIARGIGAVPSFNGIGLNRNDLLKALRLRTGWTQRQVADHLGVNRVTLASWEGGDHWPEITLLHQVCQLYKASPDEIIALTTLTPPTRNPRPTHPDEVIWEDIETYQGNFAQLELQYLTQRACLAQMPHAAARPQEIACTLDYLHSLILQPRSGEVRRELRRLAAHPALLASPTLFARHQRLYAVAQKRQPEGNRAAETTLQSLLAHGDTVPIEERCRAKAEWASRRTAQGDHKTAVRLSVAVLADAEASGDPHLLAIGQREQTARLIDAGEFSAAAKALEHFPTHTPLFRVQQIYTYAALLHEAGSHGEAISAYGEAARAAQAAGMTSYANHFTRLADSLETD